jgi:hypothetical protein
MRKWIFCLAAGLALLIVGIPLTGDPVVRCGGVQMSPGENCRVVSGGGEVVSRKTYDEVVAETEAAHHIRVIWGRTALLGGGALTLLAVCGIVVRRRRRANQEPTPGDLFFRRRAAAQAAPPYPRPPEDGRPPRRSHPGAGDDATERPT